MRSRWLWLSLASVLVLVLTGCTGLLTQVGKDNPGDARLRSPSPTGQYIVVFEERAIPAGIQAEIAAAGGEVRTEFGPIGVLVAASADPEFPNRVASLPGVQDVGSDPFLQLPGDPDDRYVALDPPADPIPAPPASGLVPMDLEDDIAWNDLYVIYQWDIKRVGGNAATWTTEQGAGVTVAVLDTGVYATHPDIALNYAYGKSFVDITIALPPGWILWDGGGAQDYEGHGTHVAGSIAASILDGRVIGVAPQASIANYKVMIAVLVPAGGGSYEATGVGMSSWIMAGLMEAADDGVHVANLSLGGSGLFTDPDDLAWFIAYARATQYAWEQGMLVISSSGNDAGDYSRGPWRSSPSMTPASLAISATGPDDSLAYYSSHGAFNADFTGPGGDVSSPPFSYCLSSYSPLNAWAPGAGWVFSIGTSMAAPKVAGVAALIIAANPGITPTGVVRILERTAEDLGKAGYDFQFGWGLAHAYRALTQ